MAAVRGQPLQALGARELNARSRITNQQITPLKSTRKLESEVEVVKAEKVVPDQPKDKAKKKKEKLSALCKTPPSLIRTRTGKDYKRGLFLGEGGFARCFQIRDDSGEVYAAKTVAKASIKSDKTKTKLLSEIKIHKSMSHSNIVQFVDCFEDDVNVYILLEICPNQSLMDLLKKRKVLTEPEVRYFMTQVIGGIRYMHTRRVIHRDLKLGNIFFDPEMNLKIGDFGLAAVLHADKDRKYTICGTPNYIAPEVLTGKTTGHSYEVDIWSIGVMLYALLVGKPPFQSKDVSLIYERIKTNDFHFPADKPISNEAKILIQDILSTNPLKRPTLDEILEYDFFKGPFPEKITVETLVSVPDFSHLDRHQSQINFMNARRNAGLIQSSQKNPVEILRSDLESEKPKTILPQSLSPGNTKSKYKEVTDMAVRPRKIEESSSKLGKARRLDDDRKTYRTSIDAIPRFSDTVLQKECEGTLTGILAAERQARSRVPNRYSTILKTPTLISKWVDYSNKHGFSYQLSSEDIGVLFNDGNTLLRVNHSNSFWYIMNDLTDGWVAQEYKMGFIPHELSRQVEIADFFAKYMKTNLCKVSNDDDSLIEETEEIFLRRYTRSDLYVMFELSNGSIQFNFRDHHKMCVSQAGSVITYISPDRTSETCLLSNVLRDGSFPSVAYDIGLDEKLALIKEALKGKVNA
ncbi:cell cycle serine/threonine-protein kinase [Wickerhamomyces ciferrii]|uniref:Serine/threonine-protein kinase n=1 Tax=Wickerhamomyces ciferrii (strain ATCC 14091 / BCRC 22168 / CBS 111 / JCM 3599 / NBRC 0793 / NRRL Y-1031 F-60-10) TaxID=1206466 RepID=K0KKD2_WICCF|nr:cell cycle serine/threonine-protein kinase [Wickerhamomyces ciferrii]CCH41929.1 cell cycle serine/threonine-protein kinase [Wickerhamomyces ciferrii]